MPEFSERLTYLDKRYEHLRKNMQNLKKKINELEEILNQDNDDDNIALINEIMATIKLEKAKLRDEASIIRGELSQAMTKENLRKIYSGEQRKEQQRKEEMEWRMAKEKEQREKEDEERRLQEELVRQREEARARLFNGVLGGTLSCSEEAGTSYSSNKQLDSTYGYESEYDNAPTHINRRVQSSKMAASKSMDFNGRAKPLSGAEILNGFCGSPASHFAATSLSNLNESRNSQDSGLGRETVIEIPGKDVIFVRPVLESDDETPRPTRLCFGRWKPSKYKSCSPIGREPKEDKKKNGHKIADRSQFEPAKQNGKIIINKNVKETAL